MARDKRITVRLTGDEAREVGWKARCHRTRPAALLRALALGYRPDTSGPTKADAWWDTLPISRREQVHRWLTAPGAPADQHAGQTVGFDL